MRYWYVKANLEQRDEKKDFSDTPTVAWQHVRTFSFLVLPFSFKAMPSALQMQSYILQCLSFEELNKGWTGLRHLAVVLRLLLFLCLICWIFGFSHL